jgi:hypothetical protein
MRAADDSMNEMNGVPLGFSDTDALLGGRLEPDDAPPGFQDVAALIGAARSGLALECTVDDPAVASAFAAASETCDGRVGIRRTHRRVLSAKVAGVAAVLTLAGTSAAAATGSLPGPVQAAFARNLSHLGVDVPPGGAPVNSVTTGGGGAGGVSTVAAEGTLCARYLSSQGGGPGFPSADRSLLAAQAESKGETVDTLCRSVSTAGASPGAGAEDTTNSDPADAAAGGPGDARDPQDQQGGPADPPASPSSPSERDAPPSAGSTANSSEGDQSGSPSASGSNENGSVSPGTAPQPSSPPEDQSTSSAPASSTGGAGSQDASVSGSNESAGPAPQAGSPGTVSG